MPTYLKCKSCAHWEDEFRIKHLCGLCNNSKLAQDPKEILCNMCGETMCPIGQMNEQHPHGLHNIHVAGSFDSYHLFDMTRYTFSMCEKCLRILFNQFLIKPTLNEEDFDGNLTEGQAWDKDQQAYEYRVWRDGGGHHSAYMNRQCNIEKDCTNTALYTILYSGQDFSEDCACEEHAAEYKQYNHYKVTKFIPHVLKAFL